MSNILFKKIFICIFSLFIPAAFAKLPVFNRYPVTSNSMGDLPGKRFHMKIHSQKVTKGKVSMENYYNLMYSGEIKIGSDNQIFKVHLDTGSSKIWIPGTQCSSIGCSDKKHFDPQSSSSFTYSGGVMKIVYGDAGKVSAAIGYDDITLGGIKVLSQGFGIANALSNSFGDAAFDGIFGLAYKPVGGNKVTTWLDNAVQQGLIDKAVFSFYLSNTPYKGGSVMIIGEPDPSYYQGPISWHYLTPLHDDLPKDYFYNISFDGISIGEKNIPLSCQTRQCRALVDTGASFIVGPSRDVESILQSLDVKPDCSNISQLPPLKFSIDGHIYEVPPQFYVVKMPNCFEMIECQAGIVGRDNRSYWILGDSFMRAFYTVFDKTNERVGFARLHDRLNAPKTLRALY